MGELGILALIIWLGWLAWHDCRTRTVPDVAILPVLAFALLYRAIYPGNFLAWLLACATLVMGAGGWLPGGDVKGLLVLALLSPSLYLSAWLGAIFFYLLWRSAGKGRRMPGYVGFLAGVLIAVLAR